MNEFWHAWRKEIIRGTALFCGVLGVFFLGRSLMHRVKEGVTHGAAFTALRDLRGELADAQGQLEGARGDIEAAANDAPRVAAGGWAYRAKVAPGQWVWIRNVRGSIKVEPTKGSTVEIRAVKTTHTPSDSGTVRVVAEPYDGGLAVCAVWNGESTHCGPKGEEYKMRGQHNDVTVDFTVLLPARVRLGASTVLGDVHVRGAQAPLSLRTVSGAVDAATTRGPVDVRSFNGGVRVRVEGFADTGAVDVQTVNGAVMAELPATLDADVHAQTTNGSISTEYGLPVHGQFVGQSVMGTLGRGGRQVTLKTINGAVQLNKIH